MTVRPTTRLALLAITAVLLAACSSGSPSATAPVAAKPVNSARAASDLKLYQTLLERKQYALAAPIGAGLVKREPASPAAAEVRKTLAATQAKADAINAKRRLAALWLYQSGEQSGGHQNTATIFPTRPAWAHDRVKLILRRHSDWGQSVYLYDTGDKGFICHRRCRLSLKIDGKPAKSLTGYLPDGGEPAMFIAHDKAFVARLEKAKTLDIKIHAKGHDAAEFHFEVGGFDAAKWPRAKHG